MGFERTPSGPANVIVLKVQISQAVLQAADNVLLDLYRTDDFYHRSKHPTRLGLTSVHNYFVYD